jgi:hypothetical protein
LHRFVDLTGKTFGERTVLGLSHQNPTSGNYYWWAKCSCGREDVVSGTRLKKGTKCPECSGRINGRKGLDSQAQNQPCYFIRCGEYVKVGCSKDPERRVKDIETNNPYPIELLFIDYQMGEKYWHDKLWDCIHRGEWYHYEKVCEIVDIGA